MLFVQDAYAAKGSKAFWHNNIGYYKKWGNSKDFPKNCKVGELKFEKI